MTSMHPLKSLVLAGLIGTLAATLPAATPQNSKLSAKPSQESIEQLLDRHETAKAEQRLNTHLAAHPMDVHAMTLFGRMREQQRLFKQAEASYRIALRADSSSEEATTALANLLSAEGRVGDAIAVVEPWFQ